MYIVTIERRRKQPAQIVVPDKDTLGMIANMLELCKTPFKVSNPGGHFGPGFFGWADFQYWKSGSYIWSS